MTAPKTAPKASPHSPFPWTMEFGSIVGPHPELEGEEMLICEMDPNGGALSEHDVANAAFILKATASHDELVYALRCALIGLKTYAPKDAWSIPHAQALLDRVDAPEAPHQEVTRKRPGM